MAAKFKDTEKKKMFFSVCDFFFLFKIEYSIPFLISKKKQPQNRRSIYCSFNIY